jgi:hypothetical protein
VTVRSIAPVVLTVVSVFAGGIGPAAAAEVPCARLLTAAEVEAAAGPGFKELGKEETAAGKSECMWLLEAANPKAIGLTFSQPGAVPDGDLAKFFTAAVSHAEGLHENKREALEGIGASAALIPGKKPGKMAILVLQMKDGVAYVETDQLERAQLLRLAKAIAAP